jgi:two-component system OmpR family sensor kinase
MNRLWVRISLTIGGVLVIAMVIISVLPMVVIDLGLRTRHSVLLLEFPGQLPVVLAEYYVAHHGWTGVEAVLSGAQAIAIVRREKTLGLRLSDKDGHLVTFYPAQAGVPDTEQTESEQTIPIEALGETVGYLDMVQIIDTSAPAADSDRPDRPPDLERSALGRLTGWLAAVAVVVGAVGIPVGVWVSRSLTAPLNRLAEGARALGTGDLSRRVEVTGSSEVRQVAHAFNEMAADLQQAEMLRRNLMADVAHELRTPLSVLQGNLRAILDDIYPLDKVEVARLYDETRLLSRLVDDLRQLALAESGQIDLKLQTVDLAVLATTAVDALSSAAEDKGITLKLAPPPGPLPLQADAARLTQVLRNLLVNAFNHTPAGGQVTVSVGRQLDSVWLTVQDTGGGIPPEHLPHVFDRFYRVDPARSRSNGGVGLGLAIVRAIVEAHGGRVTVASDGVPGRGSTFTIALPTAHQ